MKRLLAHFLLVLHAALPNLGIGKSGNEKCITRIQEPPDTEALNACRRRGRNRS